MHEQQKTDAVRLAYIILAHTDPAHIVRLCRKLAAGADVFVHIEANADITPFEAPLCNAANVHFIQPRLHCRWGGWNAVTACVELLRAALHTGEYDRIVFCRARIIPLSPAARSGSFLPGTKTPSFCARVM